MSILTVMGVGNRLYCDDGIGNNVVEELSKMNPNGQINYIVGETDIDYCLSQIEQGNLVIIDAVKMGREPGSTHMFPLDNKLIPAVTGISMHNQHLLQFIQKYPDKRLCIIGIEPFYISLHFGLSFEMEQILPEIVKASDQIIHKMI